jgi:hypothetical protein
MRSLVFETVAEVRVHFVIFVAPDQLVGVLNEDPDEPPEKHGGHEHPEECPVHGLLLTHLAAEDPDEPEPTSEHCEAAVYEKIEKPVGLLHLVGRLINDLTHGWLLERCG